MAAATVVPADVLLLLLHLLPACLLTRPPACPPA